MSWRLPGPSWSALAIKEKVLGPEHPTTSLNNLASLLRDQGALAAARSSMSAPWLSVKKCRDPTT